jgi:hypothetical protein
MSNTYATWNPSDKAAGVTLSNGNLTAVPASAVSVRSTISVSTGKWYWEIKVDSGTVDNMWAVADASANISSYPGSDAHSWAYFQSLGRKYNNGSVSAYSGNAPAVNDIIGVALDADGGSVTFYLNNVSQGAITLTGLSAPYFAMYGSGGGSVQGTANFGATALTYTPPAAYNAGLYTASASLVMPRKALLGVGL